MLDHIGVVELGDKAHRGIVIGALERIKFDGALDRLISVLMSRVGVALRPCPSAEKNATS